MRCGAICSISSFLPAFKCTDFFLGLDLLFNGNHYTFPTTINTIEWMKEKIKRNIFTNLVGIALHTGTAYTMRNGSKRKFNGIDCVLVGVCVAWLYISMWLEVYCPFWLIPCLQIHAKYKMASWIQLKSDFSLSPEAHKVYSNVTEGSELISAYADGITYPFNFERVEM